MFATAELHLTITSIPDADDLGAFIARAADYGFAVTGAGGDSERPGRFAVTVTSGEGASASEVHQRLGKLLEAAEAMKG